MTTIIRWVTIKFFMALRDTVIIIKYLIYVSMRPSFVNRIYSIYFIKIFELWFYFWEQRLAYCSGHVIPLPPKNRLYSTIHPLGGRLLYSRYFYIATMLNKWAALNSELSFLIHLHDTTTDMTLDNSAFTSQFIKMLHTLSVLTYKFKYRIYHIGTQNSICHLWSWQALT